MWPEPLTPDAIDDDAWNFRAIVRAGDRAIVASVPCAVNARAGCGVFGEMTIDDERGAPRQRQRALVLLVRESLRHAAALGVTRVHTDAPTRLAAFAARMTGMAGDSGSGGGRQFRGALVDIRTRTLDESDADGNLRS